VPDKKQMKVNNRYTPEFKRDFLALITKTSRLHIKDLSEFTGVPVGTIYRWLRENKK